MTPKISVIIPSIGRPTWRRAVDSALDADQVVLVCDGDWEPDDVPANVTVLQTAEAPDEIGPCNDHGYYARTIGMKFATGTHLAFLDDDDVYVPGAIDLFREHAADRPVIFRMEHPALGIIWREPRLYFGNVGTPMLLVPNDQAKLGEWKEYAPQFPQPGGDFNFLITCNFDEPMIWRPEIVARVDPGWSIAIVTPWLNHEELWPDYQAAVSVRRPGDELIIIDNGSAPPLDFEPAATVMPQPTNLGFARASNRGLYHATTDAVLFLNNDVVMTRADWLEQIRVRIEPGYLVGSSIRFDMHGEVDGVSYPYVDGWCLAGMRDELLALGGFPEDLEEPAYYSDNVLCFRARLAGMSLREERVGLRHKLGQTARARGDPEMEALAQRNAARWQQYVREIVNGRTDEVPAGQR